MTEETTAPETAQPTVTSVETETTDPIADIVKKYGIEETASQFQQTQQTTEQPKQPVQSISEPAKPTVPDPYDTEAFRNYLAQKEQGQTALQSQVQALASVLGTLTAREQSAKLETDIKEAVKAVDEIANIGKPRVIEAYLDAKVREDSRLKIIWDNRVKNPQALKEALKVIGKEMAEEFSVRTDPKLVEAQRARKAAQSTTATTREENPDDKVQADIEKAGGFSNYWERLVGGMN